MKFDELSIKVIGCAEEIKGIHEAQLLTYMKLVNIKIFVLSELFVVKNYFAFLCKKPVSSVNMNKKFLLCFFIILLSGSQLFSQNYTVDIDQIINKAEEGNSYFQAVLGEMYRTGEVVEQNNELALKWLTRSYDQGNALAYYNLGIMYLKGQGLSADREKAMEFLRHSYIGLIDMAEGSNPRAQSAMFVLYYYGYGVEVDQEVGIEWLNKAAQKEFPRAMYILARIYFHGFGVEVDYDISRYWFEKLAVTGDVRAQYQLGIFYAFGLGVEEDFQRAVDIFSEIQCPNEAYLNTEVEGDIIIEGLFPPKYSLTIEEGSCGETCIWSVLNSLGHEITQIEINKAGGYPGRGLHFNELFIAMDELELNYIDLSEELLFADSVILEQGYRDFLYDEVIQSVLDGNPVLLGVKVYPTRYENWACDHFILVVGYNESTDELIYNDFSNRNRISAEKLLNDNDGYSIINSFNFVIAIEYYK